MKVKITKREDGKWETEDGMIIGEEIGNLDQMIILENEAGEQKTATYGAIFNGIFSTFCTGTFCGERCVLVGRGACRHNRKAKDSGYYLM